jgi:hypothetical protein
VPNPRLQRTPAASPPSPLSRKPLGARGECNRRPLAASALLVLLAVGLLEAQAPKADPRVTGMFSNMEFDGEEDVGGFEVFIVYGNDKYFAYVQIAEGMPGDPVLVKAWIEGRKVEFDLPKGQGNLDHFKGQVTKKGLTGVFSGSDRDPVKTFLPRRASYWK